MDLSPTRLDQDADDGSSFRPRRAQRVEIRQATRLRSNDQAVIDVTVCDLSTSGFMANCMRSVLIGSYISLDLPGIGPVNAQVRWQVGRKMGAKFLDPVSLQRCDWTTDQGGT